MSLVLEPFDKDLTGFRHSPSYPGPVLLGQLLFLFLLIVEWHVGLKVVSYPPGDSDSARLSIALLLLVSLDIIDCLMHLQGCSQVDPWGIAHRHLAHWAFAIGFHLHLNALMAHKCLAASTDPRILNLVACDAEVLAFLHVHL